MRYQAPSKLSITITLVVALLASAAFAFSNPVEVRVDGQPLISDVPPVTSGKEGIFVPLRPLGDALGAQTRYEGRSGDIIVTRGDQVLHLRIASTHAKLDGMPMTLQHAPFRVRGRVMVGLNALAQAFGVRVKFDKMTARVEVDTPGVSSNRTQFQAQ
jgi:Copper amine oxidase N-terminal domain